MFFLWKYKDLRHFCPQAPSVSSPTPGTATTSTLGSGRRWWCPTRPSLRRDAVWRALGRTM